jgi:RNA polymerase sigma-70 factor (ECF subfamily)
MHGATATPARGTTIAITAPREPEDADLVAEAQAGDTHAFAQLYDRHAAVAFGLALRITRDRGLAEDVVQDSFTGAWRALDRFDPARGVWRSWLLAIVRHRAVDLLRRKHVATTPLEDVFDAVHEPDVWGRVAQRLDSDAVRSALSRLPDPQRQTLELAYFGGLTQLEISETTRTALGTVKSRARLGLMRLRAELDAVNFA